MIVIPPIDITLVLTSSTVPEVESTVYNAGSTYALDDTVYTGTVGGILTVWKSLQNGNTGNTPSSSPLWWVAIGDIYAPYDGGTTYALGDTVQDNTNHLIYESLAAGNLGNALTDEAKWLEIGPTNKYSMFDTLRNTATAVPSSMTVVITPGRRVDAIALLGLVANSAQIIVESGAVEQFNETIDLDTREVINWYSFFFERFTTQESVARFNLPPYSDAVITVTITATAGDVECGALVIGSQEYIGAVQYNAESDVLNFSTVTRDFAGGSAAMVQRRNVPKTIQAVWLDKARVNRVRKLRDYLNGTPAVWSGLDYDTSDYFEALLILGFYRRFSINLAQPETAVISLELEEI